VMAWRGKGWSCCWGHEFGARNAFLSTVENLKAGSWCSTSTLHDGLEWCWDELDTSATLFFVTDDMGPTFMGNR
jgi:hypothetical protein